jgi:hypothetical protein
MFEFIKRLFKKEHVMYGELGGKQLARPVFNEKTQSMELQIKGEKYALRGFPRQAILHGPMVPLKRYMKNFIIEALVKCMPFKIPDENLVEPVREMARVFDLLIEAEDEPDMKKLMGQMKDAVCMILHEDDAWRFRWQWAMEKLNMNKIKLNKSDKYFMRGKSFKVD